MERKITRTTITLSSSIKELVDIQKQILHVALLSKYSPSAVRARKTVQKTTRWNRQYYEAKITIDIAVEVAEQQVTLFRGY